MLLRKVRPAAPLISVVQFCHLHTCGLDKVAIAAGVSLSLGKGAWDCDVGCAIPPEKEVKDLFLCTIQRLALTHINEVKHLVVDFVHNKAMQAQEFEELATMEFPFEGIPTVPPRTDMDRLVCQFSDAQDTAVLYQSFYSACMNQLVILQKGKVAIIFD